MLSSVDQKLDIIVTSILTDATNLDIEQLEHCITEIQQGVLMNKLKFNGYKTEVIEISNQPHLRPLLNTILTVGIDDVLTSPSAKKLGVTIDNGISLAPYVQALCKSAKSQLFSII